MCCTSMCSGVVAGFTGIVPFLAVLPLFGLPDFPWVALAVGAGVVVGGLGRLAGGAGRFGGLEAGRHGQRREQGTGQRRRAEAGADGGDR
jgi:hypothetical protein